MDPRDFAKYLRRHAPERPAGRGFSRAAVIPAYDELDELPGTLDSLARALRQAPRPVAVIVVVNHPAGADPGPSLATLEYLARRTGLPGLETLYAPGMAHGVGDARRIGMDSFVASQNAHSLDDALIFSLDADTRVDEKYFRTLEAEFSAHAEADFCTVGFRHRAGETPELERAIREYEAYLRRYVELLRRAGSPYAFMSIGSAFAVRGSAYVRAGGMKSRRAGEDFHFLQELAKCGSFFESAEDLVFPSSRRSGRNPFGTGPALERIVSGKPLEHIPEAAFDLLRRLLDLVRVPENLAEAERLSGALPVPAREFLEREGFPDVWPRILANTPASPAARERAFHRWFDGLKTLRFLHAAAPGAHRA